MMCANPFLIVQAVYSTFKGQSVCYSTWADLSARMLMIDSLFIKVECQMKNGTLININSNSFFLRVIFKTITGQLQGDPNK